MVSELVAYQTFKENSSKYSGFNHATYSVFMCVIRIPTIYFQVLMRRLKTYRNRTSNHIKIKPRARINDVNDIFFVVVATDALLVNYEWIKAINDSKHIVRHTFGMISSGPINITSTNVPFIPPLPFPIAVGDLTPAIFPTMINACQLSRR